MKAQTELHLVGGGSIKVTIPIDQLAGIWEQINRNGPGGAYPFTRVTGHGSLKRVWIPVGIIQRFEEL